MLPDDLDAISELEKVNKQNAENIENNIKNIQKVGESDVEISRSKDERVEEDISEDEPTDTKQPSNTSK